MARREIDADAAEAFAGRMLGIVNDAFLALLASVGHRTGLFDRMAELPPASSAEIADATGLDERYVREWLHGLVVGGIVEFDHEEGTYALPPEHAACLTRAAGPDNVAFLAGYVSVLGEVESEVVDAFRHGRGIPYSSYPRFQSVQGEESEQVYDATLVDVSLPLVPGLVERLEAGIDVLDVGCGQGHAATLIARAFPASSVAGYDFSEEGIAAAEGKAAALGLANARFEVRDLTGFEEEERYDLVTAFDVVHDLPAPEAVLAAIHRALRPGGVFFMVDIAASSHVHENRDHPLGPTLYACSLFHCMSVSLAQGGPGLGTMWGEQKALELLAGAGFEDVTPERVEGDIMNTYYLARKI